MNGPPADYKDAPDHYTPGSLQQGPSLPRNRAFLNNNPTNFRSARGPSLPESDAGKAKWNSIANFLMLLGVALFLLTLNSS